MTETAVHPADAEIERQKAEVQPSEPEQPKADAKPEPKPKAAKRGPGRPKGSTNSLSTKALPQKGWLLCPHGKNVREEVTVHDITGQHGIAWVSYVTDEGKVECVPGKQVRMVKP